MYTHAHTNAKKKNSFKNKGTHLYTLYDGYGFDVPALYAIGFLTGAVTTPITNPLIDALGRKKSAIIYCVLEIWINQLEQYPRIWCLVVSRMVGGITTNLLATVFETWLDTEYKRLSISTTTDTKTSDADREESKEQTVKDCSSNDSNASSTTSATTPSSSSSYYETILRDAMIVSNVASIGSGYLAHILATRYGAVGPFQGAVTSTAVALVVVAIVWTENYGNTNTTTTANATKPSNTGEKNQTPPSPSLSSTCFLSSRIDETGADQAKNADRISSSNTMMTEKKTVKDYLIEAYDMICDDPRIWKIGLIQGLSAGSIQIFIFLWSPTLATFAKSTSSSHLSWWSSWAVDGDGQEPAYGLIFGAFMACGVFGGMCAPFLRRMVSSLTKPSLELDKVPLLANPSHDQIQVRGVPTPVRPMALEFLVALCYTMITGLLLVPPMMAQTTSFSSASRPFGELLSLTCTTNVCSSDANNAKAFSYSLLAFLIIEFLIGVTLPCEGVLRSIYIPSAGRATMLILPRIIVNSAVAVGVFITRYMT